MLYCVLHTWDDNVYVSGCGKMLGKTVTLMFLTLPSCKWVSEAVQGLLQVKLKWQKEMDCSTFHVRGKPSAPMVFLGFWTCNLLLSVLINIKGLEQNRLSCTMYVANLASSQMARSYNFVP